MDFSANVNSCSPPQIVNFNNMAFNDISNISIIDNCGNSYCSDKVQWAYSLDGVIWTCFMNCEDFIKNTVDIGQDFFIRARVEGGIQGIYDNGEPITDYSTSLESGFKFGTIDPNQIANLYNPYANMDGAVSLAQQLTESVSSMFGIPIYYFKLSPNVGSKDITFKEYALMDVESVKQIQLIIADGKMPSSKPEFNDFGLDWESDWETEISKSAFATAFGPTAQPMEGDLIYIPMMKRMWMVNEAYEEKAESLMWVATTFKTVLVKYQEKDSVDLGDTEQMVNSFVKNKYEDLFGDEEPFDSGIDSHDSPTYKPTNLYPVYESDATRKYMTFKTFDIIDKSYYYKGTVVADSAYKFNSIDAQLIYQQQYCGTDGTLSFIITINPTQEKLQNTILSIGNIQLMLTQDGYDAELSLLNNSKSKLSLKSNNSYFVFLRWSQSLNTIELSSAMYIYPQEIPLYKLQPFHYRFDMDHLNTVVSKYNIEMIQYEKDDVMVTNFDGYITNIKLFDVYNDNNSELLQMLPNHQHLLINDTARKIIELGGVNLS